MLNRCPANATVSIDGEDLELACVIWCEGGGDRHNGDHLVHTPASMDDRVWPNENPLSDDAPEVEGVT